MKTHYKLESWKKTLWKGTQRETKTEKTVLVNRYPKNTIIDGVNVSGRFVKDKPVISEIREKTYGSGSYKVGLSNGKIVTRLKVAEKTPEWYERKHEVLKNAEMLRCSLALNDVPYKGTDYYGFRIVAFSRRKSILETIYPQKMYEALIKFIEKCLKYRSDEFWFSHYLNYMGKIKPEKCNAYSSENGKYYLLWTKRKTGSIMKQEIHNISEL